jgi:hypothetical protein
MFADFYAQNPLLFWPLVGLVIFVTSFAAVLIYVLLGLRDRRKVGYLASLPLASDDEISLPTPDIETAEEGSAT